MHYVINNCALGFKRLFSLRLTFQIDKMVLKSRDSFLSLLPVIMHSIWRPVSLTQIVVSRRSATDSQHHSGKDENTLHNFTDSVKIRGFEGSIRFWGIEKHSYKHVQSRSMVSTVPQVCNVGVQQAYCLGLMEGK